MARKYIESDIPSIVQKVKDGVITQIRTYKLITPLFGGGAKPQEPDTVTTVRGSEVRGHLRFWWRATRGGMFGSLAEMKAEEERIWGSAAQKGKAGPSKVKVNIKVINHGIDDHPFEVTANKKGKTAIKARDGSIVPAYAAFPLQPEKKGAKIGQETVAVKVGIEFVLEISYPEEFVKEVQSTLWAWETFGGIGGRTRRGFGSLQLIESLTGNKKDAIELLNYESAESDLQNGLSKYVVSGNWHESVPHLSTKLKMKIIKPTSSSATQVWNDLIKQYQNFRQRRNKKLGLSLWPEANEIRRRLGKALNWPEEITDPKLVKKFPRSVFGLPILMHLPHDGDLTFTIQGKPDSKTDKKVERLASGLLLKPIPCANGKCVGLAMILDTPIIPPHGLEIKETMENKESVEWKLTQEDVKSTPLNKVLGNQPDVLQAFLDYLK